MRLHVHMLLQLSLDGDNCSIGAALLLLIIGEGGIVDDEAVGALKIDVFVIFALDTPALGTVTLVEAIFAAFIKGDN